MATPSSLHTVPYTRDGLRVRIRDLMVAFWINTEASQLTLSTIACQL